MVGSSWSRFFVTFSDAMGGRRFEAHCLLVKKRTCHQIRIEEFERFSASRKMPNNLKTCHRLPQQSHPRPHRNPSHRVLKKMRAIALTSQLGPSLKRRINRCDPLRNPRPLRSIFQPQAFDPASRESWRNRNKNKERWCQISEAKIGISFFDHTWYLKYLVFSRSTRQPGNLGDARCRRRGSSTKTVQNCSDLKSLAKANLGNRHEQTLTYAHIHTRC